MKYSRENVAEKRRHQNILYYDSGVIFKRKIFRMEHRPRGPMDKASDFESEDCGFDPHRGQFLLIFTFIRRQKKAKKYRCE